jgi:hypothetical protein
MEGDWETLCLKFCLKFFPISRVVSLRIEVLTLNNTRKSLLMHPRIVLMTSSPLAQTLLFQTRFFFNIFIWVLARMMHKDLNAAARGSFLSLSINEARLVLDKILGHTTCTSIHDELLEEEKESSPELEEKVLTAKS